MMIEMLSPKGNKVKGRHFDLSEKVFDHDLEAMGNFFLQRMPEGECSFGQFMEDPEWAWSIYGRSGKTFDKVLTAG